MVNYVKCGPNFKPFLTICGCSAIQISLTDSLEYFILYKRNSGNRYLNGSCLFLHIFIMKLLLFAYIVNSNNYIYKSIQKKTWNHSNLLIIVSVWF